MFTRKDIIDTVLQAPELIDTFTESSDERQQTLSARHEADMTSDNWLAKAIRPIVTMFTGLVWGVMTVKQTFDPDMTWELYAASCAPFITCISWYFESRKREKIAAQNAKANVLIEKIKTRSTIRQERKEARHERKIERRRERRQDVEDYDKRPNDNLED